MEKLTNWTAKRAGGRITVKGTDDTGHPVRIVGVDVIMRPASSLHPIATTKDGEQFVLA